MEKRTSRIAWILAILFLSNCQPSVDKKPPVQTKNLIITPADTPKSAEVTDLSNGELFQGLTAQRDKDGGVKISGKTLLPEGTKLWISLVKKGDKNPDHEEITIDSDHAFTSPTIFYRGSPFPAGELIFGIEAHFNGAWQPDRVLAVTGDGGTKIPHKYTIAEDPEFPNNSRILEYKLPISVPPLSDEDQAILAVKKAKLTIKGQGISSESVEESIKIFASAPGFEPLNWSAKSNTSGRWIVSLSFKSGEEGQKNAEWQYDPKNKTVTYLDPEAKMLSYIPSE